MQTLNVALGERSYPIHIGSGLIQRPELIVDRLPQKRVAIITNSTGGPLYLPALRRGLDERGIAAVTVVLPDGEIHKDWETVNRVFDALLETRCERATPFIPLGAAIVV